MATKKFVILQNGDKVLEVCSSYRWAMGEMRIIEKTCIEQGYTKVPCEWPDYEGIVTRIKVKSPANYEYTFTLYEREENVKFGSFPY